ncbi:MAG: 3-hydroxyacyl-CoA dehydrogenase NAD-binding domain-containing protein [Anaerolineae bacterium]
MLTKINDHTAVVAVVGLGYVGLPLAVAFAEKGFPVVGIEVDGRKVAAVQRGESYVQDIPSERLAALTNDERRTMKGHQPSTIGPRLVATTDFSILTQCDAAIIAVPTPLSKTRDPDMKYVLAAGKAVAEYVHPGMLVVTEGA